MRIADIEAGDTLVSTDANGTGYYKVLKVNRVTIDVLSENGNRVRAYPTIFDRKVTYAVPAFDQLSLLVERVMARFESALARRRAYGPPSKH